MSSSLYNNAGQMLLTGALNWTAPPHPLAAALVTAASYTPSYSTDVHLSDIETGAIVATHDLTGPTAVAGTASAAAVTFPSVSGAEVDYVVIYLDSGTPSTSALICCIESGTGLPFMPVGSDIDLAWDPSNGIFSL